MSLSKNFIYSCVLTISTYVFPLLVYPYVSRVLGLSNIGIVNFVDNLINYFVLISMMGITTVGVREIAATKEDKTKLNKTFNSLFALTAITTFVSIILLISVMFIVDELSQFQDLIYIGAIKLIFNLFLIEWFFIGIEDFRFITNRSLIIKTIYVVCIFLFIKDTSDYKIYYILTVATVIINSIINFLYSKRFVEYRINDISFLPFTRSYLIMGVYALFTNIYTSLNTVWLGLVTNTDQVGYFTTATKLHTIIMAVLLSFTNILFPRMSYLIAEGKKQEFWEKINISLDAIYLFAFPTIAFMITAGPETLHLIVGDGFEGSYLPLRIITPLVLIIGIEQILVIQIMMATHLDNYVLRNSFIGAMVALVVNLSLTRSMGAIGSAIAWDIAECSVGFMALLVIYKKFAYIFPFGRLIFYILCYIPLMLLCFILSNIIRPSITMISAVTLAIAFYTTLFEIFIIKNKVAVSLFQKIYDFKNK